MHLPTGDDALIEMMSHVRWIPAGLARAADAKKNESRSLYYFMGVMIVLMVLSMGVSYCVPSI